MKLTTPEGTFYSSRATARQNLKRKIAKMDGVTDYEIHVHCHGDRKFTATAELLMAQPAEVAADEPSATEEPAPTISKKAEKPAKGKKPPSMVGLARMIKKSAPGKKKKRAPKISIIGKNFRRKEGNVYISWVVIHKHFGKEPRPTTIQRLLNMGIPNNTAQAQYQRYTVQLKKNKAEEASK